MQRELFQKLEPLLETQSLPGLDAGPRPGVLEETELRKRFQTAMTGAALPGANRQLLEALVLLWHDHLDAAHKISQEIDNPDGAFVHGIVHRREPDYWNSKYWFRRVGAHPALEALAEQGTKLLDSNDDRGGAGFKQKLLPRGKWDPFAFVDFCEAANSAATAKDTRSALAQELQALESKELMRALLS